MSANFLAEKMGLLLVLMGAPILLVVASMLEEWVSRKMAKRGSRGVHYRPF